jgi:hypothetical protein
MPGKTLPNDALNPAIWGQVKQVRAGVKGLYGDDSSHYEMVGGACLSERKTPTLKRMIRASPSVGAVDELCDKAVISNHVTVT